MVHCVCREHPQAWVAKGQGAVGLSILLRGFRVINVLDCKL